MARSWFTDFNLSQPYNLSRNLAGSNIEPSVINMQTPCPNSGDRLYGALIGEANWGTNLDPSLPVDGSLIDPIVNMTGYFLLKAPLVALPM